MSTLHTLLNDLNEGLAEADAKYESVCLDFARCLLDHDRAVLVGVAPITSREDAMRAVETAAREVNAVMLAVCKRIIREHSAAMRAACPDVYEQWEDGLITHDECVNKTIDALAQANAA